MQSGIYTQISEFPVSVQPQPWSSFLGARPRNKFILFCAPRTGSSAISNFLRDIEVSLAYEPFRPSKWHEGGPSIKHELLRLFIKFDGIKHLYTHLNIEENLAVLDYCRDIGMNVVHLRRKDKLMAAISLILANETKVWQLQNDDPESRESYKEYQLPELLIEHIEEKIRNLLVVESVIDSIPESSKERYFYYEDLFETPDEYEAANRVGNFLNYLEIANVPYHLQMVKEHFSPGKKQNTPEIYRKIPNWKEIQEHFCVNYDPDCS